MTIEHKLILPQDMHPHHAWRVASAAARAVLVLAAADVGKVAWQRDDDTEWLLTNHSPPTWKLQSPVFDPASITTDDLSEGTANLYFTEERVQATLVGAPSGIVSGDAGPTDPIPDAIAKLQQQITATAPAASTDDLPEGSTNLYFQESRVLASTLTTVGGSIPGSLALEVGDPLSLAFDKLQEQINASSGPSLSSTDDLPEGSTNLYFNESLVLASSLDSLGGSISGGLALEVGDSVGLAFDKLQQQIDGLSSSSGPASTDDLPEGSTNLYFQESRVLASTLATVGGTLPGSPALEIGDSVGLALNKLQEQINAAGPSPSSTDDLPEGSTNLYFQESRVLASTLGEILGTLTGGTYLALGDPIQLAFNKLQLSLSEMDIILSNKQDALSDLVNINTINGMSLQDGVNLEVGYNTTRWVPASQLTPRVTGGASLSSMETGTYKVNLPYLAFDPDTQEYAQTMFPWPKGFSTLACAFYWTASSGSGDVVWDVSAQCVPGTYLDADYGTPAQIVSSLSAADNLKTSGTTASFLPYAAADGRLTLVQISRVATDGADTLTADAKLFGIKLEFSN